MEVWKPVQTGRWDAGVAVSARVLGANSGVKALLRQSPQHHTCPASESVPSHPKRQENKVGEEG